MRTSKAVDEGGKGAKLMEWPKGLSPRSLSPAPVAIVLRTRPRTVGLRQAQRRRLRPTLTGFSPVNKSSPIRFNRHPRTCVLTGVPSLRQTFAWCTCYTESSVVISRKTQVYPAVIYFRDKVGKKGRSYHSPDFFSSSKVSPLCRYAPTERYSL